MNVKLIAMTPEPQKLIETCARISYDSKNEPFDPEVNSEFIRKLIRNGHESPLEHASATFLIDGVSRACSHQIVRHRLASFSQRSSRYTEAPHECISPFEFESMEDKILREGWRHCRDAYDRLLKAGVPKENARFILPQAESTSLYMTANFREWRHFLKLRLDKHAQWEIREVAEQILYEFLHEGTYNCFFDFDRGGNVK